MLCRAMLMLQLEVNISSSQGFSLVNQTLRSAKHQPNLQTKDYARPADHNFIESLLSCVLCSIVQTSFMILIELFNSPALRVAD